jgi:hypothetical protein
MADQSQIQEPTELIYLPTPSWAPGFTAAGITALTVGAFKGIPYVVVGAILLIRAAIYWIRDTGRQVDELPRHQRLSTAVIPATSLKRESIDS